MKARCAHGAPWWREDCPGCRYTAWQTHAGLSWGWRSLLDYPQVLHHSPHWTRVFMVQEERVQQEIRDAIAEVRAANPDTDKRFHAESFYLGAVMRRMQGRCNPGLVVKLLREAE